MKGIKVVKSFIFFVVDNYKYIDNIYRDKKFQRYCYLCDLIIVVVVDRIFIYCGFFSVFCCIIFKVDVDVFFIINFCVI